MSRGPEPTAVAELDSTSKHVADSLDISPELQQRVANAILANLLQQRTYITISPVGQPKKPEAKSMNGRSAGIVGLLAFGMTTILLNLHNGGAFDLGSTVTGMGICFGGGVQLIVGIIEYFQNNNFGFIAFTSYGAFWLSLVCIWLLPTNASVTAASAHSVAAYLLLWGIFSFVMFVCTLKKNVALAFVFGSLVVLFALLAIGDFSGNETVTKVAGIEGVICGASAMYLAFAEILENQFGYWILPVIPLGGGAPRDINDEGLV